ncbi:MAG: DUF6325 family protein [Propionibacteriaceae bacterium]
MGDGTPTAAPLHGTEAAVADRGGENSQEVWMADKALPAGPVDIAVVGFPDAAPDERVTQALAKVVALGAVRVLDALVVEKDAAGEVTVIDVEDPGDALDLLGFPTDLPGLLSEDDAKDVAAELPEDTSAVIIMWENTWAVRLRQELAEAGAVFALHERIDPTQLEVTVEAVSISDRA